MTVLEAGDYHLMLDPEPGGSIAAFTWRGQPLYSATCGPSMFDVACFRLVPSPTGSRTASLRIWEAWCA